MTRSAERQDDSGIIGKALVSQNGTGRQPGATGAVALQTEAAAAIAKVFSLDRRNQAMTLSEPRWLQRLLDAVEGSYSRPVIAEDIAPSKELRSALGSLSGNLQSSMAPGPESLTMAAVTDLMLAFPMTNMSEAVAASRARAFANALDDLPAWAVVNGCRSWLRAEKGEGRENYAFPPSPPQLRRLAELHLHPVKVMHNRVTRFLRADIEKVWSEDERKANLQKLAELSKSLATIEPPKPIRNEPQGNEDTAFMQRVASDLSQRTSAETGNDGTTV